MLKNKWRVLVIAPLLSVMLLAFFLPFNLIGEPSPTNPTEIIKSFYENVVIYTIYGLPFMIVYGIPVHLFASWLSERFGGHWRWIISLGIHVAFGLFVYIFWLFSLFSALVFFGVGEVIRYLQHEELKRVLWSFTNVTILFPILIWAAIGIPSWHDSKQKRAEMAQIETEMDRLRTVGHPQPELVVNQKVYPITLNESSYGSHIDEEEKRDFEPPKIPEAFYHGMKTITVQPGEIVTIRYKNSPGEYKVRALHWENGNLVKENLTDIQLKAPTQPGIYGYSILSDWGRLISRLYFGLEVKAK